MAPIDHFIPFPSDRFTISEWFKESQDVLSQSLEKLDGKGVFREEHWSSLHKGGGRSRYMDNANCFEKAALHSQTIHGTLTDLEANLLGAQSGQEFFTSGLALDIFPHNPHIPDFHFQVHFYQLSGGQKWLSGQWWHVHGNSNGHLFENSDESFPLAFQTSSQSQFLQDKQVYPVFSDPPGDGGKFSTLDPALISVKDGSFDIVKTLFKEELNQIRRITTQHMDSPYGKDEKDAANLRRGQYAAWTLQRDKFFQTHREMGWNGNALDSFLPAMAVWK